MTGLIGIIAMLAVVTGVVALLGKLRDPWGALAIIAFAIVFIGAVAIFAH